VQWSQPINFTYPPTCARSATAAHHYSGADALVFDGLVGDEAPVACRSYLYFNRWLEIFVTFDDRLVPAGDSTASFPFAFNWDITTPYYRVGDQLFTTDLCVDSLVAADGRRYQVKDTDEYELWYRQGAFGRTWYRGVQQELAALTKMLETESFLPWLIDLVPFPSHRPPTPLSTRAHQQFASSTFADHPNYPRYD